MRLLLDTHFIIWLICDPNQLRARERELLSSTERSLFVSTISLWELRTKAEAERRRGRKSALLPGPALAILRGGDFDIIDFTPDDCAASLVSPLEHADPFDVMLLVHAQRLDARLLTRDSKLRDHPLALVP